MRHQFRVAALAFFSGTALAFSQGGAPFAALFFGLACIAARPLWMRPAGLLVLFCACGALGFGLADIANAEFRRAADALPYGSAQRFSGEILREVEQRERTQTAVVGNLADKAGNAVSGTVLARFPLLPEIEIFDRVEFQCSVERPVPSEDGGRIFFYDRFLQAQSIHALCPFPRAVLVSGKARDARAPLFAFKHAFVRALNRIFPEPEASLLTGLLFGRASAQETSIRDSFAATGLSHIVAASGWNVTMVILLVEGMLLRVLPRRAAFPAILAAVVLYCLLVGAEGSIVRAGIMGALVAFGKTFGRKGDLINILLFAGALMVLFRPALLLYDVGFQLSVVATFGLLTAADAVSGRLAFLPVALEFRETAAASVTALLFTLPISLLTFGALPLFTLAANLLSVPLLPFASLLGGAAVLLGMAFAPLGQAAALLAEGILFFIIRIAEGFAKLPGSRVPLPAFSAWVLVAVSLGGIVLFLLVRRLRRGHAA